MKTPEKTILRKSGKIHASSLVETLLALSILVVCLGVCVTLLTSISVNNTFINKLTARQGLELYKSELVKDNYSFFDKSIEGYVIFSEVIGDFEDKKLKKVKTNVLGKGLSFSHEFYVYIQ